jgi:two-component system nitrate/nitrite response regulator NarL
MEILPVLIVAQLGRARDGLQALLMAKTQVRIVGLANDLPSALDLAAEHDPELVLLDSNACDGSISDAMNQIEVKWPGARCLVLVSNVRQQQAAKSAGADGVLLKGFRAAQLFEVVEMLTKERA